MAFAIEGFQTVAQNYISRQIASNFYPKAVFLSMLGALTLGNQKKNSLEIGRPNSGEILTGGSISPIMRKSLGTVNRYRPRIQGFKTNNTKAMGTRDTMPTVANPTTASHGQAMQYAADFGWADFVTPILIWHEDKIRAGQAGTKEGQGIAMGQLIDEATQVAMQDHIDSLNTSVWSGSPSDQAADLWNDLAGMTSVFSTSNVYGNVDRSVAANSVWRAQVDSTITAVDIAKIVDDANVTKTIATVGNGINFILTSTTLYPLFKAQILNQGGTILQNGMPEMGKLGVKKELLQKDNVYIAYDAACTANYVYCYDLSVWKFMIHPIRNFTVSPFVDLSDKALGAYDADQAFIRTRAMLTCDNPFLNCLYTVVGT